MGTQVSLSICSTYSSSHILDCFQFSLKNYFYTRILYLYSSTFTCHANCYFYLSTNADPLSSATEIIRSLTKSSTLYLDSASTDLITAVNIAVSHFVLLIGTINLVARKFQRYAPYITNATDLPCGPPFRWLLSLCRFEQQFPPAARRIFAAASARAPRLCLLPRTRLRLPYIEMFDRD